MQILHRITQTTVGLQLGLQKKPLDYSRDYKKRPSDYTGITDKDRRDYRGLLAIKIGLHWNIFGLQWDYQKKPLGLQGIKCDYNRITLDYIRITF